MSADEFEKRFRRHIEFMLEQQAKFDARQAEFVERQAKFEERQAQSDERLSRIEQVQAKTVDDLHLLTGKVLELTEAVSSTQSQFERTQSQIDSAIDEMREGFNKLIGANELTNSLIEKLTLLEVQNSQRLTSVEGRVDNLEEKTS